MVFRACWTYLGSLVGALGGPWGATERVWVSLGRSCELLQPLWGPLWEQNDHVVLLGLPFGTLLEVLGSPSGAPGRSWGALGGSWALLGGLELLSGLLNPPPRGQM